MTQSLHELRERLLRAGVAPRHVRRYLTELADHLADLTAEELAGRSHADAQSAALQRLGSPDDLFAAMIHQRQLQSWSVRAPWAIFGIAPLVALAMAYFIACLILWTGWQIFLPAATNPFVEINGLAVFYFGIGRLLYFGAPVFIGWAIALIAARQRLSAIWPMFGLFLTAWIGCMARVRAVRPPSPGAAGQVSMGFSLGPSVASSLTYALVILSLTVLPYLLWRLQKAHSFTTRPR